MIKALIFDFDGVIVLNDTPRFKALQRACANNGLILKDNTFPLMVGRTARAFFADVFPGEEDQGKVQKSTEEYGREYKDNIEKYIQPVEVVVNFIKQYKGEALLGIASASTRTLLGRNLKFLGINDKFTIIVTQDEVKDLKPSPAVYLKVLEELNLASTDCVAIEDALIGVKAAIGAGIPCFVLLNGVNKMEEFDGVNIMGFINGEMELYRILQG